MAHTKRFANHPGAKEAPPEALDFRHETDTNPPFRGLTLAIASVIVPRIPGFFKLLWHNAKFGHVRSAPGLVGVPYRIHPNVIPLGDGTSSSSTPTIDADFFAQQPADLPGRFYSAADYHTLYRSGKATPVQVAEAVLSLIQRTSSASSSENSHATAWTQTDPERVRAAARASAERWAKGTPLGIMDGVPFGVKDDVDVAGFVTTLGMRVNKSEEYFKHPAEETSWAVVKLEEAGGIMMGKMNQHEIGMDTTGCNPSTGTAVNWYNPSYYTGGSSSGAGSALSGGVVPIAIGTDAGGSIRLPASFCGVYGLKPTHNRLGDKKSSVCVVGPLAATAADLTIAYRLAAQPDPSDPAQYPLAASTLPDPSAPKYLGICHEWIDVADADVRAVFDAAVADLVQRCGYTAVDIRLPYLREAQLAHSCICLTESVVEAQDRAGSGGAGGPLSRALGMLNSANRLLLGTGAQTPAVDFIRYGQLRQVVMAHLGFLFKKYPGLLVLSPTSPMAGWPRTEGDDKYGCFDGNRCIRNMTYAWLANLTGCPAVSVPAGYVEPKQGKGMLPVGLMATAEWGEEERLLAFAREREEYLNQVYEGGRKRPGGWVDVVKLAVEDKEDKGEGSREGSE